MNRNYHFSNSLRLKTILNMIYKNYQLFIYIIVIPKEWE